ncbi:hypothetical protein BSZ39_08115 [Bowdeniella nasicola]|uniref:ABC transporter domain-containing protein n=1 Tax=Bowdeniella nasicola TaxID=208480 RepID=A0A1Q5Q1P5_9ACTO|nr:ATP-binding cassette domain-containing protein [Bowdeniella nasicola]OKL53686.1 hypothetical protein BSZ39_08115 [Bowdeniella nasicola]
MAGCGRRRPRSGHAGAAPRTEGRAAKKFYADRNATVVSRRIKAARLALGRLAEAQLRKPPPVLSFAGFADEKTASADGTTLLAAANVAITGRLAPVSLEIRAGERWLVTGGNGSGKSRLMAILAGTLCPEQGTVVRGNRVRVGLLAQDWPDADLSAKISDAYRAAVGDTGPDLASLGLIRPQDIDRPLGAVSVGVRRRLQLAITIATMPDVLLLDEPTNHLSLDLVEELEAALPYYPGAVVIASHDRWLRERWRADRLAAVGVGGAAERWPRDALRRRVPYPPQRG